MKFVSAAYVGGTSRGWAPAEALRTPVSQPGLASALSDGPTRRPHRWRKTYSQSRQALKALFRSKIAEHNAAQRLAYDGLKEGDYADFGDFEANRILFGRF
jgi:hypothetical protein